MEEKSDSDFEGSDVKVAQKRAPKKATAKPKEKQMKKVKPLQQGTGKHFDINPHHLWKKQLKQRVTNPAVDLAPFERFRPFQSQVVLVDQKAGDSSLEVCPGIHLYAERYFEFGGAAEGINIPRRGPFSCRLSKAHNKDLLDKFVYVRRISKEWDYKDLPKAPLPSDMKDREAISKWIGTLMTELAEAGEGELPKEGDFIIWDIRTAHTTGDTNDSDQTRQTFYHAYLLPITACNEHIVKDLKTRRLQGLHPADFPKSWSEVERTNTYKPLLLSPLGRRLYGYEEWTGDEEINQQIKKLTHDSTNNNNNNNNNNDNSNNDNNCVNSNSDMQTDKKKRKASKNNSTTTANKKVKQNGKEEEDIENSNYSQNNNNNNKDVLKECAMVLSERQIQFFKRYGYVVVEGCLPKSLTTKLKNEISEKFLSIAGIDVADLENTLTYERWTKISGTFGGMLELYWLSSMEQIRQHPNPYCVTMQLVQRTWADDTEVTFSHPFGKLEPEKGLWLYVDRCNFRLPTAVVNNLMEKEKKKQQQKFQEQQEKAKQKDKKNASGGKQRK